MNRDNFYFCATSRNSNNSKMFLPISSTNDINWQVLKNVHPEPGTQFVWNGGNEFVQRRFAPQEQICSNVTPNISYNEKSGMSFKVSPTCSTALFKNSTNIGMMPLPTPKNPNTVTFQVDSYSKQKRRSLEKENTYVSNNLLQHSSKIPKRNRFDETTHFKSNTELFKNDNIKLLSEENKKLEEKKNQENGLAKSIFLTGTIERVIKWNRITKNCFCLYEVIAPVISIQEGRVMQQKIMLLRDFKGPILQVQYYSITHININDFHIGQNLRCVGNMTGANILTAHSIREATEEERMTLLRFSSVCDYSINQH